MRKLALLMVVLAIMGVGTLRADTISATFLPDPADLFINGGAGDPNLISGGSFDVLQNNGGAGNIANLFLFFSVPSVTSPPSGISGLTSSSGILGSIFLAGILEINNNPPCNTATGKDVYSCSGIYGTDQSNNLANFNPAELAHNGFTASQYGIFEVEITGANLGAKGTITISGNLPTGTFIDAYGIDGKHAYATPFTEAGLVVPEPATLALLGTGLLGIAGAIRHRMKK